MDPRVTLARADLASAALEGLARAERFEATRPRRTSAPGAPIYKAPDVGAEQLDQLLFGERFEVLDARDGFAWGQAARDGYVGFAPAAALSTDLVEPTHRVIVLRTFAFAEPSIKSRPFGPLSLNALVRVVGEDGHLLQAEGAGWVPASHLAAIGERFEAPADVAERFVGTPYLWGGRDSLGIDCSGLVQQALYAGGLHAPRDSDQQARLGEAIDARDLGRGDLVFWRGHVGMMLDEERLVHANAFHMAVAVEPLAQAIDRITQRDGGEPTAFRRVSRLSV